MKKVFTKICSVVFLLLIIGAAMPASAQYTKNDLADQTGVTAMCKDAAGNVYVLRYNGTYGDYNTGNAEVVEYPITGGSTTLNSNVGLDQGADGVEYESGYGIGIDGSNNIYITSYYDNGSDYGKILKLPATNYAGTPITIYTGSGSTYAYLNGLVIDSHNNLYFIAYDWNGNSGAGTYDLLEIPDVQPLTTAFTGTPTQINTHIGDAEQAWYVAHGNNYDYTPYAAMTIDASDNIFLAAAYGYSTVTANDGVDGGKLYRFKATGPGTYDGGTVLKTNMYCSALGIDPTGNLFGTVISNPATSLLACELVNYGNSVTGSNNGSTLPTGTVVYSSLGQGIRILSWGIAAISSADIYVDNGEVYNSGVEGDIYQLTTTATAASGVSFTGTTTNSTTVSWTNGNGSNRAVFINQTASTSSFPAINDATNYTASTTYGNGTTAGTGWYCVYNGSGTSVSVSNLSASLPYRVAVVEYNGTTAAGTQIFLLGTTGSVYTDASNNPNNVTTPTPTITVPGGTTTVSGTTAGTAGASTSFNISGSNLTTGNLTATAPTGFDVSANNSSWGATASIPETGTLTTTPVYVRLSASDGVSSPSGNVSISGGGATTVNQAVSGTVTNPPTTISSLSSVTTSPTNTSTITYTAIFAASVSNLNSGDFLVTSTGVAGAYVSNVTGSGTSWTVTVNTGTGDGTIQLSMNSSSGVTPSVNNVPFNSPVNYAIDKTAPTVSSIAGTTSSPTNATSETYTVTFSEAVTGVTGSAFAATESGVTNTGISVTATSSSVYAVTVSGVSGNGTLRLDLKSSGTGIQDLTGNAISGGYTGGFTYTIDQTSPTVAIGSPNVAYANSSTPVSWQVTWTDANLKTSSINPTGIFSNINTTGTASVSISINLTPGAGGNPTTAQFVGLTGDGTLGFTVPAGSATDNAGNSAAASSPSPTVIVDNTAPTVSISAPSVSTTANGPVSYTVTYADANFNANTLTASNITVNNGGSGATAGTITVTPVSSTVATVTLSSISGSGTLGISIAAGTSTDLAGNTDTGAGPSATFTIDDTPPAVNSITAVSPSNVTPTNATSVSYTVTFSEAVTGVTSGAFTATASSVSTTGITVTPVSASVYVVNITGISGDGTLRLDLNSSGTGIQDLAGNAIATGFTSGDTYIIDNTPPTATISAPSVTTIGNNGSGTVSYTVTYADANFNTSSLTGAGISLNISGTANGTVNISGSGATYTVTISNISGLGTLGISVTGGFATDLAGNTDAGAGPSATFAVLSSDATLNGLTVSNVTFTSPFAPGTLSYTANVSNAVASVTVTPAVNDGSATVTVNGVAVTSGTASAGQPLSVGDNTILVAVTAQDGTIQTYSITITRAQSSNNLLTRLSISSGSLVPVAGTPNFTVNVTNATSVLTVTPFTADPTATVTIGVNSGTAATVASGTPSGNLPLNIGTNTVTVIVTAQNGTTQPYVLTVTRAQSSNNLLTHLSISSGSLVPVAGTPNFTVNVTNATSALTVTPFTADPTATVTIGVNSGTAATVASGTPSGNLPLNVGTNTVTVIVTAQDGTTQPYVLTVTRAQSSNIALTNISISSGTLVPVAGTPNFTVNVTNATSAVTVTPFTADPTATVTIGVNGGTAATVASGTPSGNLSLNVGANTITIIVTAQDGTTQPYVLTVTRAQSSNIALTNISISSGTLVPVAGTPNYTVNVTNVTSAVTVTPFTADPTATVTIGVNGGTAATVASGTPSANLSLNVGTNTITIIVTAQDGTTQPYVITATRASLSSDISLVRISISSGTMVPVTGTPNYTASVTNATSAITVTPFTTDPASTVTIGINGGTAAAVASGTPSANLPLNVGANTITIIVTAQDGTTQPYVLTVTRAQSSNIALTHISISSGTLVPVTGTPNYTVNVTNAVTAVTVTALVTDPLSTMTISVNSGTPAAVASGTPSGNLSLNVGTNTITIIVTAQDGTTQPFVITVTRASGALLALYQPLSVTTNPGDSLSIENDGIMVHQGVSPNGDGINDVLTIDGITRYPDNSLQIIDRNGALLYQAKGYDNSSKAFDGHSNINGRLLQSGTYFYSLDYSVNGQAKHKTGFILLKY